MKTPEEILKEETEILTDVLREMEAADSTARKLAILRCLTRGLRGAPPLQEDIEILGTRPLITPGTRSIN